jgi:hypothetical protein
LVRKTAAKTNVRTYLYQVVILLFPPPQRVRHTSHEIVLTRAVPRSCTGLFGWKPTVLSITLEPQNYFYYLTAGPVVGAGTTEESTVTESATGAPAAGASSVFADEPHAVKPITATANKNLYIVNSKE